MVKGRGRPCAATVAIGTIRRGFDVRRIFAGGAGAIVATCTRSADAGVIEGGRGPRTGAVAIGAVRRRRDMGRIFAGGVGAVVAACT